MDIDSEGIYVGSENQPTLYRGGVVFPCFKDIELDCESSEGVSHVFPNFTDARAESNVPNVTVPLIILGTEVPDRQTKFEDNLDEHVFPKTDLLPPMTCLKGFHDNNFVFDCVTIVDRLMHMSLDDLVNCDIEDDPAVKYYGDVLQDKATYAPEARIGTQANKGLNDFIIRNMMGEPVTSVLDIGSGKGTSITRLERLARVDENTTIVCVEPNEELAVLCAETPTYSGANVEVHNCTAAEFFDTVENDAQYDLVVANNSVHFAHSEDGNFLDNVYAMLQGGGDFIGVFPNYDSIVFRPLYGCVHAGLVRAYINRGEFMMETDISGVRRTEPAFPFWKLIDPKWSTVFSIGSVDRAKEKEVMACFATFRSKKVARVVKRDYSVREISRQNAGHEAVFTRPSFFATRSGHEILLVHEPGEFPAVFSSKGYAVTWNDFFTLRSHTMLVTSKTDGMMAHVSWVGDKWKLKVGNSVYRIVTDQPKCDGIFQVEMIRSGKKWKLVLCEDQTTPVFVNMFSRNFPPFLYLKDYVTTLDVDRVREMLISEKEGIIIRGAFSGTAFGMDVRNAIHVKWDPTVDLAVPEGGVFEYYLNGEVKQKREDKIEGNNEDSIRSIVCNMTPMSFMAILHMPFDTTPFDLPHKNLVAYPFGTENFIERNSFVGMYLKGLLHDIHFTFPRQLLQVVVHAWSSDLWATVRQLSGKT